MLEQLLLKFQNLESLILIVSTLFGGIALIYRKLAKIYSQLIPNGGSSLADTIREIKEGQQVGQMRTQLLWEHTLEGVGYYECEPIAGECTYANRYLCDLFGLSLEEFLGFGWTKSIHSQDERVRIYKSWQAAVKESIPYNETYKIDTRNGVKTVQTKAWAARDKKTHKVLMMFGILKEVKEG